MLSAINISCQRGRQMLWKDLSLETAPGTITFIRGANGQGKSSLLRILAGLSTPYEGQVLWQGELLKKNLDDFHRSISYFGHTIPLKGDLSAINNLSYLMQIHGLSYSNDVIEQALLDWGLPARTIHLPAKLLSQGQKQRVCLAQLHLSQSVVWILDEPFNGLDMSGSNLLLTAFAKHLSQQGSIVLTSHLHSSLRLPNSPLQDCAESIIELQGV
jgi:heme exporter protein A